MEKGLFIHNSSNKHMTLFKTMNLVTQLGPAIKHKNVDVGVIVEHENIIAGGTALICRKWQRRFSNGPVCEIKGAYIISYQKKISEAPKRSLP